MGRFKTHTLVSKDGASVRSYHPYELCVPGFKMLDHWYAQSQKSEDALRSFDNQYGKYASRLGWILQRSESLGSSTIEGVTPSLRRVACAEAVAQADKSLKDAAAVEAVGNVKANEKAVEIGDRGLPITVDDLLEIQFTLMQHTRRPEIGGRLRDRWVRVNNVAENYYVAYIPPPSEEVPRLVNDLLAYVNNSPHHPAIIASVAHAQFENIHPFVDGNGRTGRALVQTIFRATGLTKAAVCPLSAMLSLRKNSYIAALRTSQYVGMPGDPAQPSSFDPTVALFSDLIDESCVYAERLIGQVNLLIRNWSNMAAHIRSDSAVHHVIQNVLPVCPVFSAEEAIKKSNVAPQTVYSALQVLKKLGIIRPMKWKHRKHRLYEASGMLDLFDVPYGRTEAISPPASQDDRTDISLLELENHVTIQQCLHIGVRSKRQCLLRAGHQGPHKYKLKGRR